MSGDLVECEQHQFCYEPYDTCPVCDGVEAERKRIQGKIMSRVIDLKFCGKNDNCEEVAQLLLDWMPEWLGEEK